MFRFFLSVIGVSIATNGFGSALFTDAKTLRDQTDAFAKAYFAKQYPHLEVNKNLFVKTGRLDSRLKLPKCDKPLIMNIKSHTHNASNATVNVSCDSTKRWSIYVPVSVEMFAYAITANTLLQKGQRVTEDILATKRVNTAKLRGGYFVNKNALLNQQALKTIRTGAIIKPSMVKAVDAIEKGDKIIIHVEHPFLSVKVNAIALESGAVGDQIRVKNSESKKTVYAIVEKSGLASISQ